MKKLLLGISVFVATLSSAQIYKDYYPTNYPGGGYYEDYDDEYYFPDDYYYEYPADYYTSDLYRSYYNDYRRSIYDVDWNRFFRTYRLSSWQVQEIMMLNDRFGSYSAWNSYYRYNPDRWYYDRFYALERILGPKVYVIFQNNYYQGYNPVSYYQNYRRVHYRPTVYVVPRYQRVNVNRYRVDRVQYHKTNPRQKIGFRDTPRGQNSQGNTGSNSSGFRKDGNVKTQEREFRNEGNYKAQNQGLRNGADPVRVAPRAKTENNERGFRPQAESPRNESGFRTPRSEAPSGAPQRKAEAAPESEKSPTPGLRPSSGGRIPGQRLTSL